MLCENERMSTVQNNGRTTGGVTGKGFMPGQVRQPPWQAEGPGRSEHPLEGARGVGRRGRRSYHQAAASGIGLNWFALAFAA
jgi:hypothetical protein